MWLFDINFQDIGHKYPKMTNRFCVFFDICKVHRHILIPRCDIRRILWIYLLCFSITLSNVLEEPITEYFSRKHTKRQDWWCLVQQQHHWCLFVKTKGPKVHVHYVEHPSWGYPVEWQWQICCSESIIFSLPNFPHNP